MAVGYLKTDDNRIEKDADRQVQDAIGRECRFSCELRRGRTGGFPAVQTLPARTSPGSPSSAPRRSCR